MTLINVHFLTRRKTPMDSHNTLPIKKLLVAEDNESNFLLVMAILKRIPDHPCRRWSGNPPKIPTILSRRHSHGSQNAKHGRIGSYP